jgi:hypothetical protein
LHRARGYRELRSKKKEINCCQNKSPYAAWVCGVELGLVLGGKSRHATQKNQLKSGEMPDFLTD